MSTSDGKISGKPQDFLEIGIKIMCVEYGKQSVNKPNAALAPNVVIPRTYLYKSQLKFLSEESSHSPVSTVEDVRGILSYSTSEVQLCYNV